MTDSTYKNALSTAKAELIHAIKQRDYWNIEVARLNQLVNALRTHLDEPQQGSLGERGLLATAGLTDLLQAVVNSSDEALTPTEVKNRLVAKGFDVSKYRNAMAMVHQTLKRLAQQGRIRGFPNGTYKRTVFYETLLPEPTKKRK